MIENQEEILTSIASESETEGTEMTAAAPNNAGAEESAGASGGHSGAEESAGSSGGSAGTEESAGSSGGSAGAEESAGASNGAGTEENAAGSGNAGAEESAGASGNSGMEESAAGSGNAGAEENTGASGGSTGAEENAGASNGAGTEGSIVGSGSAGAEENTGASGNSGMEESVVGSGNAGTGAAAGSGNANGPLGPLGPLGVISEEIETIEGETEGETTDSYVIGEDGEVQFVFDAEPETEYIVSTPASSTPEEKKPSAISRTYQAAAGTIAKTAQSAAKSAAPALKTIAFNVVNAVLIVIIGVQIAKLLRKTLNKTFEKLHMDASLQAFLTSVIYVLVCGVAGFMALERIGVSSASIIAILGSAGLAVSLSLQDFLANFAGGVIILILKPFRPGDYIVCGTAEGTVLSTSLFYTTLNTVDNRQMVLPNGALSNANLINVTAEPRRRLEIRVDISYESDIRTAKDILRRLFDEHPDIIHEEEVVVFVDSLGESGITLVGRGWIAKENYWSAKWKLTEDVKYAFDEAGVVIPYRQVVVHMPGGENGNGGDTKR